ncbi:hypothetical protein [Streptomyces laurentii]|uniref:hypothetical protein n=1 Tax=Streptomyces laurentii TaxID=39478 RepID=UPI0033FABED4
MFVPSIASGAVGRISGGGWAGAWGVVEAALCVAALVFAADEIRQGWKRKRSAD